MTQYLLVFDSRDDAEEVAEELIEDDFTQVRVIREALAGEDDSEDHDWAVYVLQDTVDDPGSAVGRALVERFEEICKERGGWLDEDLDTSFPIS